MSNGPVKLADHSNEMQTYTVEQMLIDALELVRKEPKKFSRGYLILREEIEVGFENDEDFIMHQARAQFRNDFESMGFLAHALNRRSNRLDEGSHDY